MRRALAERDRLCVWPGCERPPERCQADHAVPWVKGGRTEVEGMRMLCGKHHPLLREGWRLERTPDGRMIAHPPRPGGRRARTFGARADVAATLARAGP